jgi:hypothetical protein
MRDETLSFLYLLRVFLVSAILSPIFFYNIRFFASFFWRPIMPRRMAFSIFSGLFSSCA